MTSRSAPGINGNKPMEILKHFLVPEKQTKKQVD